MKEAWTKLAREGGGRMFGRPTEISLRGPCASVHAPRRRAVKDRAIHALRTRPTAP